MPGRVVTILADGGAGSGAGRVSGRAVESGAQWFGRAHGHDAVTVDCENLTFERVRLAEETTERATPGSRGDDRVGVRASLDEIALADTFVEECGERAPPELVLVVEWSVHRHLS
jgi:hypothetical protein